MISNLGPEIGAEVDRHHQEACQGSRSIQRLAPQSSHRDERREDHREAAMDQETLHLSRVFVFVFRNLQKQRRERERERGFQDSERMGSRI